MTDNLTLITQALPALLLVAIPVVLVRWLASDDSAEPPRLPSAPGWPRGVQEPEPEPWRIPTPIDAQRRRSRGARARVPQPRPLVAHRATGDC
jgi:hypothetical protein